MKELKKKKKVRFSEFVQVFIIPNRDQLKLLENDPFTDNKEKKEKKGRFTITSLDDSGKT
jgi:hypothetical protein